MTKLSTTEAIPALQKLGKASQNVQLEKLIVSKLDCGCHVLGYQSLLDKVSSGYFCGYLKGTEMGECLPNFTPIEQCFLNCRRPERECVERPELLKKELRESGRDHVYNVGATRWFARGAEAKYHAANNQKQ